MITVDQLRPDYLTRWRGQLTGGFMQLLSVGAVFPNAFQDHAVTETAPGHSTVLSGRWPAHTGIITNVLGVGDSTAPLIDVNGPGRVAAPVPRHRVLRLARGRAAGQPRAFGVAQGSRCHPADRHRRGRTSTGTRAGCSPPVATTGTLSRPGSGRLTPCACPSSRPGGNSAPLLADSAYAEPDSQPWENGGHDITFPHHLPSDSARAAAAFAGYPPMDSLTLAFALAGLDALKLGKGEATDLLAVSLSTTDAIGHAYGPDSREIHEQVLRLDRYLGWFLDRLFARDRARPRPHRAHGRPRRHAVSGVLRARTATPTRVG